AKGQALREQAKSVPAAMLCNLPLDSDELRSLHSTLTRFVSGLRKADAGIAKRS
ncbi:MarR family transcriptional regulator, partial [Mesorhizobium sp. M7A.F.Ca.MR.228.00.0.0]